MAGRFLVCLLAAAPALCQSADGAFQLGSKLFAEGRIEAAMSAFREAVRLEPRHAPAWKAIGVVLASRGEVEGAEAAFRNACEFQPALPDACLYFGRTLYLLDRFPAAIAVLQPVTRREPKNAEAYRLLALSLQGAGETAQSAAAFQQAMRVYRGGAADEDPGIDYAVFLFRQGKAEEAIGPAEAVLKRHPDSARGQLELGCILLALDRVEDAAAHLERAAKLDPGKPRAHLLLGNAYLRLGKTAAGEEELRRAAGR
jgi:Flp pilus assembly protein TadD